MATGSGAAWPLGCWKLFKIRPGTLKNQSYESNLSRKVICFLAMSNPRYGQTYPLCLFGSFLKVTNVLRIKLLFKLPDLLQKLRSSPSSERTKVSKHIKLQRYFTYIGRETAEMENSTFRLFRWGTFILFCKPHETCQWRPVFR